ncbi:TPA: histidine kinase [Candidatus Poribacteria bacterium]|nr:histidine kinase [Candidatus Poribacteria bacterium]HEX30282.1 histidine kinase [Candidatus Poribacteria bacterium]
MKGKADEREKLAQRLKKLEEERDDLQKRIPPHSVPVGMMMELEEIEDEIERVKERLKELDELRKGHLLS